MEHAGCTFRPGLRDNRADHNPETKLKVVSHEALPAPKMRWLGPSCSRKLHPPGQYVVPVLEKDAVGHGITHSKAETTVSDKYGTNLVENFKPSDGVPVSVIVGGFELSTNKWSRRVEATADLRSEAVLVKSPALRGIRINTLYNGTSAAHERLFEPSFLRRGDASKGAPPEANEEGFIRCVVYFAGR